MMDDMAVCDVVEGCIQQDAVAAIHSAESAPQPAKRAFTIVRHMLIRVLQMGATTYHRMCDECQQYHDTCL
jgi:hypothetical protein